MRNMIYDTGSLTEILWEMKIIIVKRLAGKRMRGTAYFRKGTRSISEEHQQYIFVRKK